MRLRRRSSHDSSNAVSTGSRELSAISELLDSALYALMRDCEWRSESVMLELMHSSQPQRTSCGIGSVAPRSSRILMIS